MAKIIAVHSFRGGTGKSNLIANLATILANAGQRIGIVDTDIQSPGIHILFGLDETKIQYSLDDYLWERCTIKEVAYDVSYTLQIASNKVIQSQGALFLVPSSIKANEIARILREGYDVARLNDGFQDLIQSLNLDYLFIDTHPGLNEETLLSIGVSDMLVVILRPDNQDFQGTTVTVDVARKLKVPKMFLVVNKALSAMNFEDLRQQMETNYQVGVIGIIPLAEEMIQLASKGAFCLYYPEHKISKTFERIVKHLTEVA